MVTPRSGQKFLAKCCAQIHKDFVSLILNSRKISAGCGSGSPALSLPPVLAAADGLSSKMTPTPSRSSFPSSCQAKFVSGLLRPRPSSPPRVSPPAQADGWQDVAKDSFNCICPSLAHALYVCHSSPLINSYSTKTHINKKERNWPRLNSWETVRSERGIY